MPTDLPTTNTEAGHGPCLVQPGLRWAVIDLMGRAYIAGAVSDENIGDRRMVRVDVPDVSTPARTIPAHARTFGAAAIFAIAWCDEAAALAAARLILHTPPSGDQEDDHAHG